MKYLPFPFPEAWKRNPFGAEPPRICHFRKYPTWSLCFDFLFGWFFFFFFALMTLISVICPPYFPPSSRAFIKRMRVSNRFRGPGLALLEAGSLDFKVKCGRRFWATDVNRKWELFPLNMPWRCFFTLIETIWLKIWAKPSPKNEKKATSSWRASLKNVVA